MKRQQQTHEVPGLVIALSSMLLGIMVAARFLPSLQADRGRSYAFDGSPLTIAAIAVATLQAEAIACHR
jgi:hypothetical protein